MARPIKRGVDYFPHPNKKGQTMFILERKWGVYGYTFWFRLLELLSSTNEYYLDMKNDVTKEFLEAETYSPIERCYEILDTLANIDAIDRELWKEHKIIWCQSLIDDLEPVFKKRNTGVPTKPSFRSENHSFRDGNHSFSEVFGAENTQRERVEKIKEEDIRKEKIKGEGEESQERGGGGENNPFLSLFKDEQFVKEALTESSANASVGSCVCEPPEPRESPSKNRILSNVQLERFNQFWFEYPKKKAKLAAMRVWVRLKPDEELFDEIMWGLRRARASMEWKREGGRFIPHPATFLNQGRWEDEYMPSEQQPTKRDLQNMSVEEYVATITRSVVPDFWEVRDGGVTHEN